jgi:hypothetical protein
MEKEPDLHHDPESAAEMAVNSVRHYLRSCGIEGREEKQKWIAGICDRVSTLELAH